MEGKKVWCNLHGVIDKKNCTEDGYVKKILVIKCKYAHIKHEQFDYFAVNLRSRLAIKGVTAC